MVLDTSYFLFKHPMMPDVGIVVPLVVTVVVVVVVNRNLGTSSSYYCCWSGMVVVDMVVDGHVVRVDVVVPLMRKVVQ